jgi:Na+-transporting NADH:ubiquinone oxidoreductase subunit NqrB
MMTFIMRGAFAFIIALSASKFFAGLFFEASEISFSVVHLGLGLVFIPTFYNSLSRIFATRLVVVEKEAFGKMMEEEMKKVKDKEE